MLGNLVTKMAVRQHAEPGDLCPATLDQGRGWDPRQHPARQG